MEIAQLQIGWRNYYHELESLGRVSTLGEAITYVESEWDYPWDGMETVLNHDDVMTAAEESMFGSEYLGFCVACGYEQDGCEPDARKYTCEDCGSKTVYGAEELIMMGF